MDRNPDAGNGFTPSPLDSGAVRNLHELSFYAVLAGSTSLIPLPFVDDWAHSYVRRRLIRAQWPAQPLSPVQEDLLLHRSRNLKTERGCLGQLLVVLVVAPLRLVLYLTRRIFKKVFFVLAVKEAVDRAAAGFQEGMLLSLASANCRLEADAGVNRDQKILQLSYALEETARECAASTLSPLMRKVFRGSYGLLFRTGRKFREMAGLLRSAPGRESGRERDFLKREEQELEGLVSSLEAALPLERKYLDAVVQRFENFARRRGLLV